MQRFVVLNVSADPALLETRSLMLKTAGYTVVEQSSTQEAANQFLAGDFDAVLLCHSLTQDQRSWLIGLIRSHSPSTPILIISARLFDFDQRARVVENDPEGLLREVAALAAKPAKTYSLGRRPA
jgi:DNA-binding response OmpR family regulator